MAAALPLSTQPQTKKMLVMDMVGWDASCDGGIGQEASREHELRNCQELLESLAATVTGSRSSKHST